MSPEVPEAAVPATACETIASPPSLISVQFDPRLPFARLKSSEALTGGLTAQVIATLVMLAEPMVPEPLETEQVCPVGLVFTVTLYAAPLASAVAKVNAPLALTLRLSPPLSCSTTVPDSPDTLPPTEKVATFVQVTATLVMLAEPMVPEPLETEQVCPVGLVFTVTLYAVPPGSAVAKVNAPLADSDKLSPPLSCSTTVPDSPDTLPPTV